jgi:two-component system response regulator HydG
MPHALIVEDDPNSLSGLSAILAADGFSVDTATTLAEARSALTRFIPDVVLVDLNLPDGSGLELTRKLKAHPVTAEIPILACTAAVLPADEHEALEAGCDAYVSKPIDLHRFQTIVASMLAA